MKAPPPQIRAWVTQVIAPVLGGAGFVYEALSGRDRLGFLAACLTLIGLRLADRGDGKRGDE